MTEETRDLIDKWLDEYGYTDGDVLEDEEGESFVWSIDETGKKNKLYILEEINAQ